MVLLWVQPSSSPSSSLSRDPLCAASASSDHPGSCCLHPREHSGHPKSPGENSGRAGTHSLLVSHTITFSLLQESGSAASHGTDVPGLDITALLALAKGTGVCSLYHVSHKPLWTHATRQKRFIPLFCLGRGVRKVSLSMLMSHNYLLTAKTNGRNGESDTKSKMSQVIDSCHLPSPQPRLARETQW